MTDEKATKKHLLKVDKNLTATLVTIITIFVLLIAVYFMIDHFLRGYALNRMEDGVNTVIKEVSYILDRDSKLLKAAASTFEEVGDFKDVESLQEVLRTNSKLFETMNLNILLPDDRLVAADGNVYNVEGKISFENEAKLGEHVSDRVTNVITGTPVIRQYVPIIQNGEAVAVLYGVTDLNTLSVDLNVDNIYNDSASVYIIDTNNGDLLLDTYPTHKELGNIHQYDEKNYARQTKGNLTWNEYMQEIMDLKTGYVIFKTAQTDGWDYMYYAPANINNWVIAVEVPEKEAFKSVFAVRQMCIALGIMLVIIVVAYYLYMRRNAKIVMEGAVKHAVLKEKLHKAEAADKAKSIFLSNMSHDIRTPMNAIIGYTTLVQTSLDNREKTEEYLKKILSSSNHMLSLVNDVLDMSRIESGKLNIEEKECTISDIFRDMRNIIQTQMQSKQLNFYMDTVDIINEDVYCDKLHINQVLLNLLSNAIKFTPAGGTVALTIQQKPTVKNGYGTYEIRVKDTGIGISKGFIEHIFEPFERERNTTASGIQGTGLGMAITKNIIDAMGGSITVTSEQGKGTEFVIELDLRLQSDPKNFEAIRELQGLRALIADDSFTTCDSISKMLRQIGMRSDWVLHGKEAVLHAKQAHEIGDDYSAYIIDWLLPDLNGLEVVRQVRAIVGYDTPIIIVTAYDWTEFEDEARKVGVTAFCSKPIFLSELRDTLVSATCGRISEAKAESDTVQTQEFTGTRLLLVEDNELNREIAEELLTERGFTVDKAENGEIGVEMVKNAKHGYYSAILMDIQMPRMNGYDATKNIRALQDKELANIPIIAMTANAFEEDKKLALECGMNAHIAKPINVDILMETLENILGTYKR